MDAKHPPLMATHEVINQAHALENYNAYSRNLPLQEAAAREGAGDSGNEFHPGRIREVVFVENDRAVAVEEEGLAHGSSAT